MAMQTQTTSMVKFTIRNRNSSYPNGKHFAEQQYVYSLPNVALGNDVVKWQGIPCYFDYFSFNEQTCYRDTSYTGCQLVSLAKKDMMVEVVPSVEKCLWVFNALRAISFGHQAVTCRVYDDPIVYLEECSLIGDEIDREHSGYGCCIVPSFDEDSRILHWTSGSGQTTVHMQLPFEEKSFNEDLLPQIYIATTHEPSEKRWSGGQTNKEEQQFLVSFWNTLLLGCKNEVRRLLKENMSTFARIVASDASSFLEIFGDTFSSEEIEVLRTFSEFELTTVTNGGTAVPIGGDLGCLYWLEPAGADDFNLEVFGFDVDSMLIVDCMNVEETIEDFLKRLNLHDCQLAILRSCLRVLHRDMHNMPEVTPLIKGDIYHQWLKDNKVI